MTDTQNTDPETLKNIVKAMEALKFWLLATLCSTALCMARLIRISPESPVPVLSITRENTMLGGAGNALSSVVGLKASAQMLSVIGVDPQGKDVANAVEKLDVSAAHLIQDADRPTIIKSRFLAGHQQLLRTDFEKNVSVSQDMEEKIIAAAKALLPNMKAILISDYGKGMLTKTVLQEVISSARDLNIPVIVDPKGTDYSIYTGATAVTPNKKELSEAMAGLSVNTDEEVIFAAQSLIKACAIEAVIATRSQDGMSIIQNNAEPTHLRTTALEVFDVSGAGDVVIATVTAALAAGASLEQAGALANIAGGIAVSKVGTTPIRTKELLDALDDEKMGAHIQPASEKSTAERMLQAPSCDWDEAKEQVERWRARGLKVGFTNGCFDILHFGHVSYLNQARGDCDRLVVALNSDQSVKALKGPERPVHDESSRSEVLAALGAVDMVVLFGGETAQDDQTANALLNKLQPDIYFKGGDYKVEDIPETPTVQKYGGKVKVLSVFDGHSTTGSIEKMKSDAA